MKQVKVLIVQNEEEGPKIAEDLRLQPQCEVVGVVYSGKEAIREIDRDGFVAAGSGRV